MKTTVTKKSNKPTAKLSDELTKKYSGKIIFKEKYERVKAYFEGRDMAKEVEQALKN